jgi:hypothetical protein
MNNDADGVVHRSHSNAILDDNGILKIANGKIEGYNLVNE